MAQASQLSPELARGVLQLARALLAAARTWTLYPPDHPAVAQSIARFADATHAASGGGVLSIGVTPDTLLVEGAPADRTQTGIAEAAALLHDRDILQITSSATCPRGAPEVLSGPHPRPGGTPRARRPGADLGRGGPSVDRDRADRLREGAAREQATAPSTARARRPVAIDRDVDRGRAESGLRRARAATAAGHRGQPADIADLATAVMAPKCALDGSPMITSQAATVLAAFRHLTSIVSVMSPERMPEVMGNLAAAAAQLDPHVVMQMLQTEDEPGGVSPSCSGLAAAFDDMQGRAAAGDGAGARRTGVGPARHDLQHHRARRGSQAARADADARPCSARPTSASRHSSRRSGRRWRSCSSPTTTSRSSPSRTDGARRRRRARRADGRRRSAAGAARLDGQPRPGQRPHAVGDAADRSADARARRGARPATSPPTWRRWPKTC